MLTENEKSLIRGLQEYAENRRNGDDAHSYLMILLRDPRPEICTAIQPEWITTSFEVWADSFGQGQVKGPHCKDMIDLILGTKDQRLIGALKEEWIRNTRKTLADMFAESKFRLSQ
jgi:hypothetical protein